MPKAECDRRIKRSIHLDSDSWAMLKLTTLKNCQNAQCKQIKGALDSLFLALDEALQQIPIKK